MKDVNFIAPSEALHSLRFWAIFVMFFNGLFFCAYNSSVYKTNAQNNSDESLSDHTLTLAGAIGSMCNGGSTLIWAILVDKFGFKKVYFLIMVLELAVSLVIY